MNTAVIIRVDVKIDVNNRQALKPDKRNTIFFEEVERNGQR
jgi:hypothetical protein